MTQWFASTRRRSWDSRCDDFETEWRLLGTWGLNVWKLVGNYVEIPQFQKINMSSRLSFIHFPFEHLRRISVITLSDRGKIDPWGRARGRWWRGGWAWSALDDPGEVWFLLMICAHPHVENNILTQSPTRIETWIYHFDRSFRYR